MYPVIAKTHHKNKNFRISNGNRFHPLLVPLVMNEWSYTFTPPMGYTACAEPQCLYKGALYLFFFNGNRKGLQDRLICIE